MQGANDRNPHGIGRTEVSGHASSYAHLSPTYPWKAVEGLTQVGTATKTVTEETTLGEDTHKLLNLVVGRLGLEPSALALKER